MTLSESACWDEWAMLSAKRLSRSAAVAPCQPCATAAAMMAQCVWPLHCDAGVESRWEFGLQVRRCQRKWEMVGRLWILLQNVSFALCKACRLGASETLTPEDIEVDWLGGYWKLPNADMILDSNGDRREALSIFWPCDVLELSAWESELVLFEELQLASGAHHQPS